MKIRLIGLTASLALALSASVQAQDDDFVVQRTDYGQPDLEGVWNFSSFIPMERPAFFGDKQFLTDEEIAALAAQTEAGLQAINNIGVGGYNTFWTEMGGDKDNRTSLITYPLNGRLPETVEGVPIQVGGLGPDEPGVRPTRMVVGGIAKDGPEDRGISERCIVGFNSGPPFTPNLYNNNVQIIQHRDTVVIMTEMIHDARIVSLDKGEHIDEDIRQWTGDSRGYWDGDTLVVETRNFNDLTQSFSVYGSAKDKFLTERFTRVDEFTVNYEFTIDDPSTFRDKIVAMVPMAKVDGLMYEYACHEGNYGMMNTLRGARMEEQRAAEGGQ
ncbi:MAG: hypothetical protein HOF74_07795 [Gammaproteobacteria bacterium]|jgi:hypothetical protein|nr:hypothetical protein [Gammaproteobacteria bacterium]MBT3859716.1 hypothetical protein [Gammaproteobacteria bacterium]MBT3987237.1 hypothetical protein [Gammaproteobacteria bacterium]MBT4581571.1 hypothetical protein [Gammaproteobacteria bacterium]MBT4659459.1 hypothetical protein [Gammaproteobacteria bacterium]